MIYIILFIRAIIAGFGSGFGFRFAGSFWDAIVEVIETEKVKSYDKTTTKQSSNILFEAIEFIADAFTEGVKIGIYGKIDSEANKALNNAVERFNEKVKELEKRRQRKEAA